MSSGEEAGQEIGASLSINLLEKWTVINCCCKLLKGGTEDPVGRQFY
jgi:hypothetical protein